MATGGYFNHYDDPDEYWDDEPLVPKKSRTQTVSVSPPIGSKLPVDEPTAHVEPTFITDSSADSRVGSSFVEMELDGGCLPQCVTLSPHWNRYVAPREVSDELMRAYRAAVEQHLDRLWSTPGHRPQPHEISEAAIPDHRTILIVLLETRTWDEYSSESSSMINSGHFRASGQVIFHGLRPVQLTADVSRLLSIEVRSDWAAIAQPESIVDEILWCADQIRSMRPKRIVKEEYSGYTDADLEFQLDQHRLWLLEERMRHGR
ncbi:hypothetical protein ACIBCD_37030 [Nocardia brasiliensis]|uniref:hypothetical protein n=1 Tax=Nocardia brasiliensis TaxID=37326 RepID=UPI0037B299E3